jgi:glyoxylase-like metal-dependent hydrolase (beta-lactamase superfamily II)
MRKSVEYFARREALKIAAAGALAIAMPSLLFGRQPARRPVEVPWPGYDTFSLGEFEVTMVYDGGFPVDVAPEYFALEQDPEEIFSLLKARFLPTDRAIETIVPTIIDNGTDVILFDTGLGAGGRDKQAGQLLSRMKASGYEREDVTAVALTHLHADNIGGLLEDGRPTFPNASKYFVGEKEYRFWSQEAGMGNADLAALVSNTLEPLTDKLSLVAPGEAIAKGVKAVEAFGHTPGHLMFELTSGGRSLLIAGDLATHFVISFERPEWQTRKDHDPEMAASTRARILADVAQRRIPLICYHLPFPPVGFVEPNEATFRWVPETYQLSL